jgi:hypothetical protein
VRTPERNTTSVSRAGGLMGGGYQEGEAR